MAGAVDLRRPLRRDGLPPERLRPALLRLADDWWSPEHLLLASLSLCLKTTFEALAGKQGLRIGRYTSQAEGVLDKTREGLLFTLIVVSVELVVAVADVERGARLLETAKRYCIVANALKAPVELGTSVTAAA